MRNRCRSLDRSLYRFRRRFSAEIFEYCYKIENDTITCDNNLGYARYRNRSCRDTFTIPSHYSLKSREKYAERLTSSVSTLTTRGAKWRLSREVSFDCDLCMTYVWRLAIFTRIIFRRSSVGCTFGALFLSFPENWEITAPDAHPIANSLFII